MLVSKEKPLLSSGFLLGWLGFFNALGGSPGPHFFEGMHHPASSLVAFTSGYCLTIGRYELKSVTTLLIS